MWHDRAIFSFFASALLLSACCLCAVVLGFSGRASRGRRRGFFPPMLRRVFFSRPISLFDRSPNGEARIPRAWVATKHTEPCVSSDSSWSICSDRNGPSKRNKYSNFSKAACLNPQAHAMKSFLLRSQAKNSLAAPEAKLGTTVVVSSPELESNRMPEPLRSPTVVNRIDPSDPFSFGFCRIGYVAGARGLQGEVVIKLDSAFGTSFCSAGTVLYIRKPHRCAPRPVRLVAARVQQHSKELKVYGFFENAMSRPLAELYKGYEVFVKNSDRYKVIHSPKDGSVDEEYLIRDLVGLRCLLSPDVSPTAKAPQQALRWNAGQGITPMNSVHFGASISVAVIVGRVEGVVTPEQLCGGDRSAENVMHALLEISKYGSNKCFMVPFVGAMVPHLDLDAGLVVLAPRCASLLSMTHDPATDRRKIRGALPSRLVNPNNDTT